MKTPSSPSSRRAFTLIEVMIAVVIFCTATFAILALVSQSIENARRLQRPMIDAGLLASQISTTNKLVEGTTSGNLGDLLGDAYQGYTWTEDVVEEQTNKLFHVDIVIQRAGAADNSVVSSERFLFYKPQSPAGTLDGSTGFR